MTENNKFISAHLFSDVLYYPKVANHIVTGIVTIDIPLLMW